MIIILASVQVRPELLEEALRRSQEHVERSRAEPGCISHGVNQAFEDPNRLVFVERWADRAAMTLHFGVPAARTFARDLGDMAEQPADMKIYEAEPLS